MTPVWGAHQTTGAQDENNVLHNTGRLPLLRFVPTGMKYYCLQTNVGLGCLVVSIVGAKNS